MVKQLAGTANPVISQISYGGSFQSLSCGSLSRLGSDSWFKEVEHTRGTESDFKTGVPGLRYQT